MAAVGAVRWSWQGMLVIISTALMLVYVSQHFKSPAVVVSSPPNLGAELNNNVNSLTTRHVAQEKLVMEAGVPSTPLVNTSGSVQVKSPIPTPPMAALNLPLAKLDSDGRNWSVNSGQTSKNNESQIKSPPLISPSISLVNFRGSAQTNAPVPAPTINTPTLANPSAKSEPQPPYPANFHYLRVEDMHLLAAGQCGTPNSNCLRGGCSPGTGVTTCLACSPGDRPDTYCPSGNSPAAGNCPFCSSGRYAGDPTTSCQPGTTVTNWPDTTADATAVNDCPNICGAGFYANWGNDRVRSFGATA